MPTLVTKTTPSDVSFWQHLHRLADAFVLPVRDRVMATLRALSAHIPLAPLRVSLEADDLAGAVVGIETALTDAAPALWHAALDPLAQEVIVPAAALTAGVAELAVSVQVDPGIATLMDQYAGARIVQVSETTREAIRGIIVRATEANLPLRSQVAEIRAEIGLTERMSRTVSLYRQGLEEVGMPLPRLEQLVQQRIQALKQQRALMIARTEVQDHAAFGQELAWRQQVTDGLLDMREWARFWDIADERACPTICEPIPEMNPDGRGLDEPFDTPIGPLQRPTAHPNCVTGDTLIDACGIQGSSERWYEGPVVRIETTAGNILTCTPNHPVLTNEGWIAAGLLDKCCHRIGSSITKSPRSLDNMDDNNCPPRMEDLVHAFRQTCGMPSMPMPVTAMDFHGDGEGSKIAIIDTDSVLGNGLNTAHAQHALHNTFIWRHIALSLFCQCCTPAFLCRGTSAQYGLMCRLGLLLSLLWRHMLPLQSFGFRVPTTFNPLIIQSSLNDAASYLVALRQGFDRHPLLIQCEQFCFWQWNATFWDKFWTTIRLNNDSAYLQDTIESRGTYPILASQLQARCASVITFDNLRSIQMSHFRGHVYNLQTKDGYYVANNIITHNCRCVVTLRRRPL